MNQTNVNQLKTMLALQEASCAMYNPNWRKDRPAYADAIWTEAAEAFNHTRWEWWKEQKSGIDYGQINMEIVDVWHFVLSELLLHDEVDGVTYTGLIETIGREVQAADLGFGMEAVKRALRTMVGSAIVPQDESRIVMILASFVRLMRVVGMSWDTLYKLYVGKNALNQFRQDNGYKTDTKAYKSKWAEEKGWEDNQYLTEYLNTLESIPENSTEFRKQIMDALQTMYDSRDGSQTNKNES
jgi:dimeric dUTPase (all-alpha-NTP-PPase superfamily)